MRYLSIEEVEGLGYIPHLVYGRDVYSFRNNHGEIFGFTSETYDFAVLLVDFPKGEPAKPGVRLPA